jgi:Tol biopolymer transport system component
MKRSHATRSVWAATLALLGVTALAIAACGGSDTSAPNSPSPRSSVPSFTDVMSGSSPVAEVVKVVKSSLIPLPAPTVAGTISFSGVVRPTGDSIPDNADIFVVRADGTHLKQLTDSPEWEEHPSWSPDGTRIVYDVASNSFPREDPSIWVMSADGSGKARLTHGYLPHWSRDGERIVFTRSLAPPKYDVIFVMDADGSDVRLVTQRPSGQAHPSWTPDGRRVLFTDGWDDGCAVNLDGSGRVKLTQTKGKLLTDVAASPDGKWYAYPSYQDAAVCVARLSGKGTPVTVLEGLRDYLVAGSGDVTVAWTPDSKAVSVANSTGEGTAGSQIFVVNVDGSGLSAVPGIVSAIDPAWRPE